jgi:hypothetical protein
MLKYRNFKTAFCPVGRPEPSAGSILQIEPHILNGISKFRITFDVRKIPMFGLIVDD